MKETKKSNNLHSNIGRSKQTLAVPYNQKSVNKLVGFLCLPLRSTDFLSRNCRTELDLERLLVCPQISFLLGSTLKNIG
ncbi:Uncharacterized protein APZ42_031377 [Daphnia magna]|uniref:Uncharacterized protein n=1 Tax=Daphnia magna TaxID=35525 RepID=A0A164MWL9_9CRUS|nr:Uncharacterized protein APZ42_031377 [Daphnia magna]